MEIAELWKGYTLEGSSSEAVFMIHGFTGTSAELYPAAERVHALGYTVLVPFMAGNTNNKEDLKKTNADDWLESIRKEYRIARKRYNRLYVLGLSMGGSIALILAEEEEQKPDGLILYEPCLTIRNKLAYLAGFLKIFVPKMNFSPLSLPDHMEVYMQGPNGYYTKALQDLVKLSRRAKKNLSLVSVPFLCFYSLKDEMITFSGIKKLLAVSSSKDKNLHILSGSEHIISLASSREEVFTATADCLLSWKRKSTKKVS